MSGKQSLAQLKTRIRALEGHRLAPAASLRLGIDILDAALGSGGLPLACVHEVYGDGTDTTPAAGFVAAILTLLPAGPVVWISGEAAPYMPGLLPFGGQDDLLFVQARSATDRLWAMEEGLRWPGIKAVVGELEWFDLTATRRLQLAAESSGVTGFILAGREQGLSSGVTRWLVAPAATSQAGKPSWHVDLLRCRGGRTASCTAQWDGAFSTRQPATLLQEVDR